MNIKKYLKNTPRKMRGKKSGATLVELIAVVAILAFISTSCVSAMFGMVSVAKEGQRLSESERVCALLNDEFSIYGNTANYIESYTAMPALKVYNASTATDGFMDGTTDTAVFYVDYFICADNSKDNRILFQKFTRTLTGGGETKTVTSIDGIDSLTFTLKTLNLNTSSSEFKYLLEYTINTQYKFNVTAGVVLNNSNKSIVIPALSGTPEGDFTIYAKGSAGYNDGTVSGSVKNSTNCLRIRTTNRELNEMDEADVIAANPNATSTAAPITAPAAPVTAAPVTTPGGGGGGGGATTTSTTAPAGGGGGGATTTSTTAPAGGGGGGGGGATTTSTTAPAGGGGGGAVIVPGETTSTTEPVVGTRTVILTNNKNWSDVYCYYWKGTSDNFGKEWPGTSMTQNGKNQYNQDLYEIKVPASAEYIVFNNKGSDQTVNIPLSASNIDVPVKYYIADTKDGEGHYNVGTWS